MKNSAIVFEGAKIEKKSKGKRRKGKDFFKIKKVPELREPFLFM